MSQTKNRGELLAQRLQELGVEDSPAIVRGEKPLTRGVNVEVERSNGAVAPNGESYHVKIRASTASIARDGGIVPIRAWKRGGLKNFTDNPVILAFHSHRDPIGISVHTEIQNGELVEYWRFHEETETSRVMRALYEKGYMRAASVGFLVQEYKLFSELSKEEQSQMKKEYGADAENLYWIAERCELLETSAVPVPSDPRALAFSAAVSNARAIGMDVSALVRGTDERNNNGSETMITEEQFKEVQDRLAATEADLAEMRAVVDKLVQERASGTEETPKEQQEAPKTEPAARSDEAPKPEENRSADDESVEMVTIELDVKDGETDEQALARYIDQQVASLTGAPVPESK